MPDRRKDLTGELLVTEPRRKRVLRDPIESLRSRDPNEIGPIASTLMPRPWVKQAYTGGVQDQRALAQLFGVSGAAMAPRLRQLGLTLERPHWKTLSSGDGAGVSHYFRRGLPAVAAERVRVGGPAAGRRGKLGARG